MIDTSFLSSSLLLYAWFMFVAYLLSMASIKDSDEVWSRLALHRPLWIYKPSSPSRHGEPIVVHHSTSPTSFQVCFLLHHLLFFLPPYSCSSSFITSSSSSSSTASSSHSSSLVHTVYTGISTNGMYQSSWDKYNVWDEIAFLGFNPLVFYSFATFILW